jgi:hypothetical protein
MKNNKVFIFTEFFIKMKRKFSRLELEEVIYNLEYKSYINEQLDIYKINKYLKNPSNNDDEKDNYLNFRIIISSTIERYLYYISKVNFKKHNKNIETMINNFFIKINNKPINIIDIINVIKKIDDSIIEYFEMNI